MADANILLRIANRADPDYLQTVRAVFECRKVEAVCVGPQALYEFWAVATRDPANNGLGMDRDRSSRWIAYFQRLLRFLEEPPALFQRWAALVRAHDIKGFRSHDARYVALMDVLKIDKLLTYNGRHFREFGVTILDPCKI